MYIRPIRPIETPVDIHSDGPVLKSKPPVKKRKIGSPRAVFEGKAEMTKEGHVKADFIEFAGRIILTKKKDH
jgi:hypothetical protein